MDSEISVEVREVDDLIAAEAVIVCNSISETLFGSFVGTYAELLFRGESHWSSFSGFAGRFNTDHGSS